ncbi:MAG: aminotransferase class III-fold pyridoxal phosphate-dependent enzyme [Anaerolineae bacterium]
MTHDPLYHLSPVWAHMTTIQMDRGEGVYIYDVSGKRYIDFTCGIGVTNTGHGHPRIVKVIQEQATKLVHGQITLIIPQTAIELAEALAKVTPDPIDCFFFSNSGAEATEGAVKLARMATRRTNIITMAGSFHGRTAQAMAMTNSKTSYRVGYQPLPSGVFVTPYPYSYFYGWDEDQTVDFCIKQFKHLLKTQTAPEETAAVVIEPVLGEGGYVPAPARYLQELREICTEHGIMFVADEVQTGFGRTGKFWAFEHAGIVPDIVIMAKGLGSGMPISGVGASRALMEKWPTGSHGGTFGGGAIQTAVAAETVRVMQDEDLPGNAARMGEYLMNALKELQAEFPVIGDVRGRGLMVGVEFTDNHGYPDKTTAKAVLAECISHQLLVLSCGPGENVIRWIPPLIVTKEHLDEALAIFTEALSIATGMSQTAGA